MMCLPAEWVNCNNNKTSSSFTGNECNDNQKMNLNKLKEDIKGITESDEEKKKKHFV